MSMHLFFRVLVATAMMLQMANQSNPGGQHMEAKGTFEVKSNPQEATALEKSMGVGRYEFEKVWLGDFSGTSKVDMLSSYTESTGSMAYVAMEQMTGTLGGKNGSFYLAHRATMTKGDAASGEMNIVVVKGSGTGQLAGLSGQLTIIIDGGGKHSYAFEYAFN
jgi:Protein of unknown function (DUF3224)